MSFSKLLTSTALLIPLAGFAAASPVSYTITGVVTSGSDTSGEFGTAGADLSNAAYSLTYTYDVDAAAFHTDGETFAQTFGGAWYGSTSPVTSVILTINGAALSFGSSVHSLATTGHNLWYPGAMFEAEAAEESDTFIPGHHTSSYIFDYVVATTGTSLPDITNPGPLTHDYGSGLGYFNYVVIDLSTGLTVNAASGYLWANGSAVSLPADTTTPVPLPATGGLALAGLALLAGRRVRHGAA